MQICNKAMQYRYAVKIWNKYYYATTTLLYYYYYYYYYSAGCLQRNIQPTISCLVEWQGHSTQHLYIHQCSICCWGSMLG